MMDFEELFDHYFTSKNELEENLDELQNCDLYNQDFTEISKNEERGTAFFSKFIGKNLNLQANPPFEVCGIKTYVLSERPDLLRI